MTELGPEFQGRTRIWLLRVSSSTLSMPGKVRRAQHKMSLRSRDKEDLATRDDPQSRRREKHSSLRFLLFHWNSRSLVLNSLSINKRMIVLINNTCLQIRPHGDSDPRKSDWNGQILFVPNIGNNRFPIAKVKLQTAPVKSRAVSQCLDWVWLVFVY